MPKRNDRHPDQDANLELPAGDESIQAGKGQAFDAQVDIRVVHYRCRFADPDGLSVKAAVDGLVHCGILRDDSAKEIREIRHQQIKVTRPEDERTEITITEIREMSNE